MMAAQTKILAAQTSSKIAQLTDTNFLWFCWYGVAGWPCMTSNKLFYNWVSCFSGSIFVKAAVNPSASRMSVPSIYCLQKQKKLWTVGCQFVYPSLPKCTSMLFCPLNARLSAIYHLQNVPFIYKHNSKHSLYWDATFYDIVSFFAECSSKPFLHWLSGLSAICLSFTKWSNYEHYCHWAAS